MTADVTMPPQARPGAPAAAQELSRSEASALFVEHGDYVWNALRRLGVSQVDLEDLTHDTFVAVFRQWRGFDTSRPLRPWLFGFALRVASDHRRRARHRLEVSDEGVELVDPVPDATELLARKEREAMAQAALVAVELSRRAVLILHELDGATLPEVAAALEIPLGTATSRLRLARADFAAAIKRLCLRVR